MNVITEIKWRAYAENEGFHVQVLVYGNPADIKLVVQESRMALEISSAKEFSFGSEHGQLITPELGTVVKRFTRQIISVEALKAETPSGPVPPAPAILAEPTKEAVQLKLAKAAIHHTLNAIADDPRKFWLIGPLTGSYEKLTEAAAAIWEKPLEKIQADFQPEPAKWKRYCEQKEADEKLLEFCREHGITGAPGQVVTVQNP